MVSVVIAVAIAVVAGLIALLIRTRRPAEPPTQREYGAPNQLDRRDFDAAEEWLVVVFTSESCHVCADVMAKARVLESGSVAVREAEFTRHRRLHERYSIDAVPTTVISDSEGVVRRSILGPVTATDLWVAVADARDPGSSDSTRHCSGHD